MFELCLLVYFCSCAVIYLLIDYQSSFHLQIILLLFLDRTLSFLCNSVYIEVESLVFGINMNTD